MEKQASVALTVTALTAVCCGVLIAEGVLDGHGLSVFGLIFLVFMTAITVPIMLAGCYMAMTGKGSWAVSGYNTMDPVQQACYNTDLLCRDTGLLVTLIMAPLTVGLFAYTTLQAWSAFMVCLAVMAVIMVAGVWQMNTKKRYLRDPRMTVPPRQRLSRRQKGAIAATVLLVTAGAAVGIYYLAGVGSVTAAAEAEGLTVEAPGVHEQIAYAEMQDVELRPSFDPGTRQAGFGGTHVISGHWYNGEFGDYVLAAYKDAETWLIITGTDGGRLVVALETAAATAALYEEVQGHRAV